MKTVLTIAGSDPSGGAGLQADLKVFSDFGVSGLSAVTALTVQDGRDVTAVRPVPSGFLVDQVRVLLGRYTVDAVKIGMLATAASVKALGGLIKKEGFKKVVLDPVFCSTTGFALLSAEGIEDMKRLLPLVTVVTPNLEEASLLCKRRVRTVKDMKEAATRLHSLGAPNVVVTGGHLKKSAVDILYDGVEFHYFEGERLSGSLESFHGTGCLFSSAVAAGLAKGKGLERAVSDARGYVAKLLAKASRGARA